MITEEVKTKTTKRLKIIEGQLKGIQNLIDRDTYCIDVLTQISAVHEALRGVGKVIVKNHLETCVAHEINGEKGNKHNEELLDIIYKLSK